MGCALNNLDCLEPFRLWEQCNAKGIPTDSWFGKANSYRCPLGMEAGRAYVLIRKEQLNDLYLSGVGHTITFTSPDQPAIVLKGFSIVRATAIIPSEQNDLNMPFLVELADKRHLFKMTTIDKSYNVRSTPGSETFYPASLNGGLKWSWQGMVTDIWEHAVLTFQTGIALPFAPMPFPEEFKFWGMYAWDALGIVLDRLGCALKYNPTLDVDPFTIVRIGVDDAAEAAGEVLYNDRRLWDEYPIEPAIGRIPQFVRVQFLKQPQQAGTSPWVTKDKTDTADPTPIEDVELGSTFIVKDDLPALYDSNGTLTNNADLETRAEERAADVFRQLKKGSTRLVKVFKGAISDAGLLPGSRIKATAWEDRGVAGKTEIYRGHNAGSFLFEPIANEVVAGGGSFDVEEADGVPILRSVNRLILKQDTGIRIDVTDITVNTATNADPIVVTTNQDHGLQTGDKPIVFGVLGNTNANITSNKTITRIDSRRFSIDGTAGNGNYAGGGVVSLPSSARVEISEPGALTTIFYVNTASQCFQGNFTAYFSRLAFTNGRLTSTVPDPINIP